MRVCDSHHQYCKSAGLILKKEETMDRNIIKSTKAIASILILLLFVSCSNAPEAETSTTTENKT